MRHLYFNGAMVIIGIGCNVGERQALLDAAVAHLSVFIDELVCSPAMETPAMLPAGAPESWNIPFLNMAVAGNTHLSPELLLAELKAIEHKLGRIDRGHWGPREIDLDILAMDDLVIELPNLCIPHKELLKRDFALRPLAAIAPYWWYPVAGAYYGKTASELADML